MAYELNARHLLAGPIREIARAKQHLIDLLSSHVREWRLQPLTVKLFGSAARSEMTDGSDIDVLVVMPDGADRDEAEARVGNLASVTRDLTGNDVRPLLYFESEVEQAGIFDSILADGIDIAGDPSWLRRNLRARG
ncbi:nucleotidyltransferase domain-containing protein [Agrococcus casei]|nr:nucleotidyltransferase domain-containing protein [Agrococcus casei]